MMNYRITIPTRNYYPAFFLIMLFAIAQPSNGQQVKVTNNLTGDFYTQFASLPNNSRTIVYFQDSVKCVVEPYYGYHKNGETGRIVNFFFTKKEHFGKMKVLFSSNGKQEISYLDVKKLNEKYTYLLPKGVSVHKDAEVGFNLSKSGVELSKSFTVPQKRQWTVYLYPHSHVDIGYTNTHKNVELIHSRNLLNGIELGKKTANYPNGSQYLWNPEVLWPVVKYLEDATSEQQKSLFEGVKNGYLKLDAGYANIMTSAASEEELIEYFRFSNKYEQVTGNEMETLVQVDVPGMTWGMVPVASKMGVKYCLSFNNGYDRVGRSVAHSFRPFWWLDSGEKNKMLFLQAGSYNPGALLKGHQFWPKMAGQSDPTKLIEIVRTDNPREKFIEPYIERVLPELENSGYYPYNIFVMSWAMADNTPIDADLPEAVKSWNEEYAYPKLVISGATEILKEFDTRYGKDIPVLKGDFTEHWTDGLGTAAKHAGMNRSSKERLLQAETLWTMLQPGNSAPRDEFEKAWENVLLGTEHTWCYMVPDQQPISDDILKVKLGFFEKAESMSMELLDRALAPVTDESSKIAVFNTLSWNRTGIVTISKEKSANYNSVLDANKKAVLSQRPSTGEIIFYAEDIPALGSRVYTLSKKKNRENGTLAVDNILDNGLVKLVIDPNTGDISSMIADKKEFVKKQGACALNTYKYLHADDSSEKATTATNNSYVVKENGPLMATIRIESQAEGCNSLLREVTVYKNLPHVEIKNILDKQAITDKEGVHFGFAFNIENPTTTADIPWGLMEIEKEQLLGANRNWITAQRWVDVSNDERGVTWVSLDAPVFEVNDITANIIGSASGSDQWIPKLNPNGTLYSWALNNHWHTNFKLSQEGEIIFRYHLLPYGSKKNLGKANRFGVESFQPLIAKVVKEDFESTQLMRIEGNPLVTASVFKTSKDGKSALLRIKSLSGKDEKVSLLWPGKQPQSIQMYDLNTAKVNGRLDGAITIPSKDFVTLKVIW